MPKVRSIKVFVSGCYDIMHAGHVQFFEDAKALGDNLTVCFASDEVLKMCKGRISAIPEDNKACLIKSLKMVDRVVKSSNLDPIFDFVDHIKNIKPDILAVTDDDKHIQKKELFCKDNGIKLMVLPKRNNFSQVSTTSILKKISGLEHLPLRVDFAGGWLDVPKFSRVGKFIVNCTISPLVSLEDWPYEKGGGLGGSAASEMLMAKNGVMSELNTGVGWQDPAVIGETGLCVWQSGNMPVLETKYNPDWLNEKMLIYWTGNSHRTPGLTSLKRDYDLISQAGEVAFQAAREKDLTLLGKAIDISYQVQLDEGMKKLPSINGSISKKYLGGGHGGYALYLFIDATERDRALKGYTQTKKIEPYIREIKP